VQHREVRPSLETDPQAAARPFSALFDKQLERTRKTPPNSRFPRQVLISEEFTAKSFNANALAKIGGGITNQ
jgi:hypothetical protein